MLTQAQQIADELIRIRRDIHQHPELGFQEFRTAALVADTLREIGLSPRTQIGRTGVVAELGPEDGPIIAIRADMDALPIHEKTEAAYASQTPGVMHACGHDAHTAIALGAAHLLKQSLATEKWRGRVRFLFQPSEEWADANGISGATAMIEDGALEGVSRVIALHVWSSVPASLCLFQDQYSLAAVDSFEAWIRGTGGHGAYPHASTDPIYMLSTILSALYAIPSRLINPLRPCVVSIGQVHGGAASNVIPNQVYLQGTIRSHQEEIRQKLWAEIENALKFSTLMGGSYELKIQKGYPAMYNDSEVNDWLKASARDLIGKEKIIETEFGMGSEDFAYMTRAAKGSMFMLGAALPDGIIRNHHTDIFDIDESVIPIGAAILAETARRFVTGGGS